MLKMRLFLKFFVFVYFLQSCKWEFNPKTFKVLESDCDVRHTYNTMEYCVIKCHIGYIVGSRYKSGKIICLENGWSFGNYIIDSTVDICEGKTNYQHHYEEKLKEKTNKKILEYGYDFKKVDKSVSLRKIEKNENFDVFLATCNYGNFLESVFDSAILVRRNIDGKLAITEYGLYNFRPLSIIMRCPLRCKAFYPRVDDVLFEKNCFGNKYVEHGQKCRVIFENNKNKRDKSYLNNFLCFSGNWYLTIGKKFHRLQTLKRGYIPIIYNERNRVIDGFCPYLPNEKETFKYKRCRYEKGVAKCNYKCKKSLNNKKNEKEKTITCKGNGFSEPDCEYSFKCVCPDFGESSKVDCQRYSDEMTSVYVNCETENKLKKIWGTCVKGTWFYVHETNKGVIKSITTKNAINMCIRNQSIKKCVKPELRDRMAAISCYGDSFKMECVFVCTRFSRAFPIKKFSDVNYNYNTGSISCLNGVWSEFNYGCFLI